MIRAPTYLCLSVILSLFVIPSTVSAGEMSSKRDCAICHIMWIDDFRTDKKTLIKWQPGNVLMKDTQGVVSSEEICYSCHDGYVADSRYVVWKYNRHKTFIKPSNRVTVPSTLPLSNKGEIYCGTCHSAHGVGADTNSNRPNTTSFFRIKNVDSNLCSMCHKNETDYRQSNGHPLNTTAIKIPEALFDLGGVRARNKNKVICQSCHKVHGAKGKKITIVNNQDSKICTTCHVFQKGLIGTKHDLRLSMPDEENIKQQTPSESGPCSACHTPHNAVGKRIWARHLDPGDPATWMCMTCHGQKSGYPIKHLGNYSHPIDVYPDSKTASTRKLPLFLAGLKKSTAGRVQCFTCHEVHRWSPNTAPDHVNKNAEGDASNSFLRISNSESSALCIQCHTDKKQVVTSDHNLTVTAPEEKNLQGFVPGISGPCGACHIPHNAVSKKLWAKQLVGDKDMVTQFCTACHHTNGAAKTKLIGDNYHPVDVAFEELNLKEGGKEISTLLPFFDRAGNRMPDGKDGKMVCITCHDPHHWNPKDSGPVLNYTFKNMEGDATNSFLRKPNFPSSDLCKSCHVNEARVDGTYHDLNVTAPTAVNLLGQTVKESGPCGACHLVHNSPNTLKLWARPYGPISKKESIMDALCTGCHSKGNIAGNKVPRIATHPQKKLISNVIQFYRDKKNYTPIFDNNGNEVNFGNLSCPSCHNAHRWSIKTADIKKNPGNSDTGKFLRIKSYNMVCKDCHGAEALFRYQYFHVPEKRKELKKIQKGNTPREQVQRNRSRKVEIGNRN